MFNPGEGKDLWFDLSVKVQEIVASEQPLTLEHKRVQPNHEHKIK